MGAYNTTTPVLAAYSYDMLGRVAEIDAGTGRVKLTYDYAAQEHNIAGIRFDHRPGTPYSNYSIRYNKNEKHSNENRRVVYYFTICIMQSRFP